jgi:hypothetical protein
MCSLYMCSLNKLGRPSGQKKVPIKKKRHLSEPSEVRVTDDVGRSFGEAITCVKMCVYVREREREREREKDEWRKLLKKCHMRRRRHVI